MKITLLCSDPLHPVNGYISKWIRKNEKTHEISLVRKVSELMGGDILFLLSCSEIIAEYVRKKYKFCLLLHASDLPKGRGWSPHIWEIINGVVRLLCSRPPVFQRLRAQTW